MENKNNLPPARKGEGISKKLKKIITFFTCIVLVFVSVCCYSCVNFAYGYSYYETLNDNSILIGQTLEKDLLPKTIEEELASLTNDGYYIVSSKLDIETLCKPTVVRKSATNDADIKQAIKDNLDVEVLLTKLTIKGYNDTYYFKTQKECSDYVSALNKIQKIETKEDNDIGKAKLVSNQQSLDKFKADYKAKVEKAKAEAAKRERQASLKVTSRGSDTIRSSKTSGKQAAPMASYVYISSPYGMRHGKMHTGTDFAASSGTSVYAWKSGKVITSHWSGGYGNFIEIKHSDGTVSRYAHLSGYAVSAGQTVKAGQTIGYVGSTGNSTGPHLHFEIKVNGSFVNPLNYL